MSAETGEARVRALAERDAYARWLGAELVTADPRRVTLRLTIGEAHLNSYGYCHGGVIFSLADAAFALASNAPGEVAVAIDAHITFTTAVQAGAVLTATAEERSRTRRIGTYRIEVRDASDALVSGFTGTVYRTGKPAPP